MEKPKTGSFTGWAIVEMMGHRKEIGYVTTEAFGPALLFRVDTPGLEEREFVLTSPQYATVDNEGRRSWCAPGTKVKRPATPPRSCLVSPNSLYAMNPCTEEAARAAIEAAQARPLIALDLPSDLRQIQAADLPDGLDDDDDDAEDESRGGGFF